ncbi:MAG: exodeoxyribonuclease V subunit gamma, partial [Burkholderiales bacterium]|nr:exodeoxyribonuclease V subunit gamma [Burkholderiales bacterium]
TLPLAGPGERVADGLRDELLAALRAWRELEAAHPVAAPKEALQRRVAGVDFDDWLDGLRDAGAGRRIAIELRAGRLCRRAANRRPGIAADKLVAAWVRMLAAAACGHAIETALVGRDALVRLEPLPREAAQRHFDALVGAWRAGMDAPLPLALRSGLKWAERGDEGAAAAVYDGRPGRPGEGAEPGLARCYPDFEALVADGRCAALVQALYEPLLAWATRPLQLTRHGAGDDD